MTKKSVSYKSMDQRSHVIHRPDMYIGSTKNTTSEEYILNSEYKIVKKKVKTNPGLVRIFIEAVSNAIDNVWRSKEFDIECSKIKINIDSSTGETKVWNDGLTIPVEINEQKIYNPEMIFGKLLTSSNYDDKEERKTSGRNGLGVKLTNIFSKEFKIRLHDTKTGNSYVQTWKDNMSVQSPAKITESEQKSGFTEVSWIPDFEKFGLEGYTEDILSVLYKHIIDTAMITGISVYLNDEKVPVKSLKDYAELYFTTDEMLSIKTDQCDVVICPTDEPDFSAISFVNGVETKDGGIHVDNWSETIFRPILEKINTGKKGQPQLNIRDVKQFFRIFVNATLVNPEFGSQDKSKLVSPIVKTVFDTKHLNAIMKWSTIEKIRDIIKSKELLVLKKTEKKKGFKKIEGFDPANNAGTKYSKDCTLILCEGLSAKTYAVMGIDVGAYGKSGRDWFGIYPLRGKILNVRNATTTTISKNREVTDIIQALGIRYGVDYKNDDNFDTLNYGKVMLLCDSDCDGLHISGLILNLFHALFPTVLCRDETFIVNMKTPLVRLYLKNSELSFYSSEEFKKYISKNPEHKGRVKYFKGLGTSSDKEVRNSFGKKIVKYIRDDKTDDNMNKVFHQKQSDQRKDWLEQYDPEDQYDIDLDEMSISDFMDKEMIKFSIDDCKRSIPNVIDGFKESHRKIMYATFLKNLRYSGKTMKVAQLSGFVAEKTNYHHGEQCLFDTITKLAHDFPGSNNIPLLYRDGQFGTRLSGGKDAASARYIFTKLDALTRYIFREEDDVLLEKVIDDGEEVEPVKYVPIIPMILVNGCIAGIGTGWSCSVPCYNPIDLIECIKVWLNSDEEDASYPTLKPWYRNFKGKIEKNSSNKFTTYGNIIDEGNKATVNELPIGLWTDKFKEFVEDLVENKELKGYKNYSTPDTVNIQITETKDGIKCNHETLKLKTQINTTNMVLFTSDNRIKKYDTPYDIIDEFCTVRYDMYVARKKFILAKLEQELKILSNKARFINDVMDEKLVLNRRDEIDIVNDLEEMKYDKNNCSEEESEAQDEDSKIKSYRYLLDMKIRSFSKQKLEELNGEIQKLEGQIRTLRNKTEKQIWMEELDEFVEQYNKWNKAPVEKSKKK
jgi:DNA topoisomerase-2